MKQRLRLALTIGGIALCAILMLFLLSIYRGIAVGSLEYIRSSEADLWVLQRHAGNILRSTSILYGSIGNRIAELPGVQSADPVIFVMAAADTKAGPATLYLTGYNIESGTGGPPRITSGRNIAADEEIVLDQAFAAKFKIAIGDQLPINTDTLRVVGLSNGTNMFVIQYAFISLVKAYEILGFPNIATCFQVRISPGSNIDTVVDHIASAIPGVAVYNRDTFLENNKREMDSGILPLLYVIALITAIVLTAILSLILTVSVLERRKEFAIMKAIGSPRGFVSGLVIREALLFAFLGLAVAIPLFYPLVAMVRKATPEVSPMQSMEHILYVMIGVVIISLISTIIPNRRLHSIYPIEVFQ